MLFLSDPHEDHANIHVPTPNRPREPSLHLMLKYRKGGQWSVSQLFFFQFIGTFGILILFQTPKGVQTELLTFICECVRCIPRVLNTVTNWLSKTVPSLFRSNMAKASFISSICRSVNWSARLVMLCPTGWSGVRSQSRLRKPSKLQKKNFTLFYGVWMEFEVIFTFFILCF